MFKNWDEYLQSTRRCTCGVWKVYGKTYPVNKHSDYCDLRREITFEELLDMDTIEIKNEGAD